MRRTDFGDGPGVRGDLHSVCFYHLPDLDSGLGPRETSRYTDEGESGSGADGGESVMSGVFCLRKFWCAKTSARTIRWD